MPDPIKPGDLVMVARPTLCCSGALDVGHIYRVVGIEDDGWMCLRCRKPLAVVALRSGSRAQDIRRLIKIDPPALPETVPQRQEEPA